MEIIKSKRNDIAYEISRLGEFVLVYKNGKYIEELDMKNPCDDGNVIANYAWTVYGDMQYATKNGNNVNLVMSNGDIVEYRKSTKKYMTEEEVKVYLKINFSDNKLVKENIERFWCKNHKKTKEYITEEELESTLTNFYNNRNRKTVYKAISINQDNILFYNDVYTNYEKCYYTRIYNEGYFKEYINDEVNIIITNKFKQHMQVHQDQFSIPYQNLISYMKNNRTFENLDKDFIEMVVEFPFNVGYSDLCKVKDSDNIIYAKRKDRSIYSKFLIGRESTEIDKCVVVLKRSYDKPNEYYLITMFPGEYCIKEPQDKNIKSEDEKNNIMKFWDKHAFVFKLDEIDKNTITKVCPYIMV